MIWPFTDMPRVIRKDLAVVILPGYGWRQNKTRNLIAQDKSEVGAMAEADQKL